MSTLPPARRIITGELAPSLLVFPTHSEAGHDEDGNAIFMSDETLRPTDPRKSDGTLADGKFAGFVNIHRSQGMPAINQGSIRDCYGKAMSLTKPDCVTCRIVDFPPLHKSGIDVEVDSLMHRTLSLDYGVVLKGTIQCVLDNGVEKTINEGDVVVQR